MITREGGRSGYESFEKEGNRIYVIAQFYPRMAVYNDVEGWQNMQFWEAASSLCHLDFDVNITVPADHVMEATGELMNRSEVFTPSSKRYELAQKRLTNLIVTQAEAEAAEKAFLIRKKHGNLALKMLEISSPLRENSFLTLWLFN
jgi:hypothetical protein